MVNLFFGYLFVLMNITVSIKGFSFDVLPDFIGFIIIARAAASLAMDSEHFKKTVLPSRIMVGLTAFAWVTFGISALGEIKFLGTVRSVMLLVIQLAVVGILYYQIKGLSEIETNTGYYMKTFKLHNDWMILAVACVLTCISIYGIIMTIANYAKLIFSVLFLLDLNTAIKAYTSKTERPADAPIPGVKPKRGAKTAVQADSVEEPEISFSAEESESEEDA